LPTWSESESESWRIGEPMNAGVQKRQLISLYRGLDVYKMAMDWAIRIFDLTKTFPMIDNPRPWLIVSRRAMGGPLREPETR